MKLGQITYEQVLKFIQQLPVNKLLQLRSALDAKLDKPKAVQEVSDFQQFLLSAPVMTDDELSEFRENRMYLNQWRMN